MYNLFWLKISFLIVYLSNIDTAHVCVKIVLKNYFLIRDGVRFIAETNGTPSPNQWVLGWDGVHFIALKKISVNYHNLVDMNPIHSLKRKDA